MNSVTRDVLAEQVQIANISFFEISATRSEIADDLPDSVSADVEEGLDEAGEEEILPVYALQTAHRDDDMGFRVRIRTEIEVDIGNISVDLAVEYELTEIKASHISPEVMIDFVNNISVMTLVPYIRQAIADITLRVFGSALTMPILQRGELAFSVAD